MRQVSVSGEIVCQKPITNVLFRWLEWWMLVCLFKCWLAVGSNLKVQVTPAVARAYLGKTLPYVHSYGRTHSPINQQSLGRI